MVILKSPIDLNVINTKYNEVFDTVMKTKGGNVNLDQACLMLSVQLLLSIAINVHNIAARQQGRGQ